MKTIRNTVLFLLFFFPLIAFAQKNTNNDEKKFAVGFGYNFLNVLNEDIKFRPFEISAKYAITKRHVVYLSVPFRTSDSYTERQSGPPTDYYPISYYQTWDTHRGLWGIGVGYNYNCFSYAHFTGFVGAGFEFLKRKEDFKYYTLTIKEGVEFEANINDIAHKKAYSFVPQIGLKYNWRFLEAELKYKFHISGTKETSARVGSEMPYLPENETIYYQGLSISLYYLF